MNNNIQLTYLALLRSSLLEENSVKPNIVLSDKQWLQVYQLSQQQATVGVCYKALSLLLKEHLPPRSILFQWASQANFIQELNKKKERTLQDIMTQLASVDVAVAVMKGISFADNYKNPELRMCGDLDLFITDKYDKAIAFLKQQGYELAISPQHASLNYIGVRVELHHHIINQPFKGDIHYSILSKETNQHVKYLTFDIETQALLLLTHAVTHLAGPGISFRFLYDWAAFLQRHSEELNTDSFKQGIKRYHLTRFVSVFTTAANECLGIEHPSFTPKNHSFLVKSLVKDMFTQGDCGQIERHKRSRFNKIFNYLYGLIRLLKFLPYGISVSMKIAIEKIK